MATIKILQLSHQKRKDGTLPIVFRITEGRRSKYTKSGFSVHEKYFDSDSFGKWVKNHPDANLINSALEVKRHKLMSELIANDLSEIQNIPEKKITLAEAIRQQLKSHEARQQVQAHIRLIINMNFLSECFNINIPIDSIKTSHVNKYIDFRYSKGNAASTVKKNLTDLAGVLSFIDYEGKNYFAIAAQKIKPKPTKRDKLDLDDLRKLENKAFSGNCDLSRDMFLASYYLHGIRFENVATLQWAQIMGDTIYLQTNKGMKHKSIKLHHKLISIFDKYKANAGKYIFPVIQKDFDPWTKKEVIGNANSLVNKYLRIAAGRAGIEKDVHFHMARHTFATLLLYEGVSISIVKDALGHSKEATTRIYTKQFEDDVVNLEAGKLFDK